jgi:hypothetical protein
VAANARGAIQAPLVRTACSEARIEGEPQALSKPTQMAVPLQMAKACGLTGEQYGSLKRNVWPRGRKLHSGTFCEE